MGNYYKIDSYRTVESANYSLYDDVTTCPNSILKEHVFLYIINGSCEFFENNTSYTLYPDDVIILHAGTHHYGQITCAANTKTMFLHINNDSLDKLIVSDPIVFNPVGQADYNLLSHELTNVVPLNTVLHCQGYPQIKELFQRIISVYLSQSTTRLFKLSHLANLLLCEMSECKPDEADTIDSVTSQIVNMIQQNPQIFYTNKEISKSFYVCEKTLNNHFKKVYSKSIYEYQISYKLNLVRTFLSDYPNVKLREIALNYGFCDEFHLSRMFKKQFGMSPKEYRATLR